MAHEGVFLDTRPLSASPAFRRLCLGLGASQLGNQVTVFAITFQIYSLTGSAFAVGAIGLCIALPAIALALMGGALGDRMDRRSLVLRATSCQTIVALVLMLQAWADLSSLPLLYALVAVQFMLGSLNVPAIATFLPRLLPPDQVRVGVALRVLTMHVSLLAGPMVAGVLVGVIGLRGLYGLDVLSFCAALYAVWCLPSMMPRSDGARVTVRGGRAIAAGLRFVASNPAIASALLADLSLTLLGLPNALIPALSSERFGDDAVVLGFLMGAPAMGGLLAMVLSGPIRRIKAAAHAMLIAGASWGACVVSFGLVSSLWLTLAMLLMIGAIDSLVVVLRGSIVQLATPDGLRGRTAAAEYVVGNVGPQLGNFRAGALAAMTSPAISAVIGGLSTIAAVALLAVAPRRHAAAPVMGGARE